MALFSIPELRQEARMHPRPIIAVSHADLGVGDATHILNQWAMELIQYARQLGYSVIDIGGSNLTYERMTDILMQTKPVALFNFSHGCRTYLMGNDMKCSLTRGEQDPGSCGVCGMPSNLKAIEGTAIVAFSCHSGAQLGKCAIQYGSPMYVGFSDNLIVVSDKFGTQNIFKESLLPLAKRLLDGWTAGDAIDATRNDLLNNVKLYKPVELISVPLYYNKKYLVLEGNPNWKLFQINDIEIDVSRQKENITWY